MNFYFEAAKTLDKLDAKQGSIRGVIGTLPEKDRRRTTALVIETLKCKSSSRPHGAVIFVFQLLSDRQVRPQ